MIISVIILTAIVLIYAIIMTGIACKILRRAKRSIHSIDDKLKLMRAQIYDVRCMLRVINDRYKDDNCVSIDDNLRECSANEIKDIPVARVKIDDLAPNINELLNKSNRPRRRKRNDNNEKK